MIPLVSNTGITKATTPRGLASILTSNTCQPKTRSTPYIILVQGSGAVTTVDERKSAAGRLIKLGVPFTIQLAGLNNPTKMKGASSRLLPLR
jgi:hypothetical protein